jgi:hypothetical protein
MPHRLTSQLSEIERAPAAFAGAFAKINIAIKILRSLANMKGVGGITVTWSDANVIIGGSGGGGLPAGYAEEEFTICEDGAPVDVFLLVRRE